MAKLEGVPFETEWTQNALEAQAWIVHLEHAGSRIVEERLAREGTGAGGTLNGVGQNHITRGFAQDWLAWRRGKDAETEAKRAKTALIFNIITAAATTVSAIVAIIALFMMSKP